MKFLRVITNTRQEQLQTMISAQRREMDRTFRDLSIALADYNTDYLASSANKLRQLASKMQHFDLADALKELERLALSSARPQQLYEAMDPVIEQIPMTRKAA